MFNPEGGQSGLTGHAVGGGVSVVITVTVPHVVDGSMVVSPVDVPVVVIVIVVSEQGVIGAEVVVEVVVVVVVVVGLDVVVVVVEVEVELVVVVVLVEQEVVVVEVVEHEVEVELGQSELQPGPPPPGAAGRCTETCASCAWAGLRPWARAARLPQATRLWKPNAFMLGTVINLFGID